MIRFGRRSFLLGAAAAATLPRRACAQEAAIRDSAGRSLAVPPRVQRVFPAGPPAAILLYAMAPELLLGWPRANSPEERAFLLPEVGARPTLGRLTGRGNTTNLEEVLKLAPDLILDVGTIDPTYVSLADRVQAQVGIPYALLDGRLPGTPESCRMLGRLLRQESRGQEFGRYAEAILDSVLHRLPRGEGGPRTYYARGPLGLETALAGSINVESLEIMGARNVASGQRGGLATVSLEQVLAWDPEVIVTVDRDFAASVRRDPNWAGIAAVREGRVHLSPSLPFGWVDFPPGINRLIGLWWLGKVLYPTLFPEDLRPIVGDFFQRFYHVTVTTTEVEALLAGSR